MKKLTAEEFATKVMENGTELEPETEEDIPELDELLNPQSPHEAVVATKLAADGTNLYHVYCPTSWLDLWGWRD